MVTFNDHYYDINRKMMCLVGIWPYQKPLDKILHKFVILLFMFTAMTAQISSIFTSGYDTDVIIKSLTIEGVVCVVYVKYANYSLNHDRIKKLMDDLIHSWQLLDTKEEFELLRQETEEGRKYVTYTTLFIASVIMSSSVTASVWPYLIDIILPLNETRPRDFFVPLEYFVDTQKYFLIFVIHVDISIIFGVFVLLAADSLLITCTYHAHGLFQVCGYQLQHAFDEFDKTFKSTHGHRTFREKLARGVSFHRRAISYTKAITDAYSLSNFIFMTIFVLSMSLTLYSFSIHMNEIREFMVNSTFVTSQMSQLFLLIYPSQRIMDVSALVLHKAYNARWYLTPSVSQKLCILTMQRSATPSVVTVGKLFVFSLEQYATLIQATASYFMVLCSLKM